MSESTVMLDRLEWARILQSIDAPNNIYVGIQDLLDVIAKQQAKLTRQDAVVKALQAVEWVYEYSFTCPWCLAPEIEGHKNDCQRQKALEER